MRGPISDHGHLDERNPWFIDATLSFYIKESEPTNLSLLLLLLLLLSSVPPLPRSIIDKRDIPTDRFLIHGDAKWKSIWDWVLVFFVLYNAIMIPWAFSFETKPILALDIFDYLIDFTFVVRRGREWHETW